MPKSKSNPVKLRSATLRYETALRKIAQHVGAVINSFPVGTPESAAAIERILTRYAASLDEWARQAALNMLTATHRADERAWITLTKEMSRAIRDEIQNTPTGHILHRLLEEQVSLIKSIPLDAAQRVHTLTTEGRTTSRRASDIAKEIMRSTEVSKAKATLIARTETSRAASAFTQARAQRIGSEGYIWRTSEDGRVRSSHRKMEGKFVRWDSPPTLDNLHGHAGCLPNCRCFPEPVIPE